MELIKRLSTPAADIVVCTFSASIPSSVRAPYIRVCAFIVDSGEVPSGRNAKCIQETLYVSKPVPARGTTARSGRVQAIGVATWEAEKALAVHQEGVGPAVAS